MATSAYAEIADEDALIVRVGAGDVEAFESLYERYGALVYSTALRVLAETHAAEDITQEIFVRLWRRPDRYDPARGRFVSWLLSVTRNRAVDEVRSRGRRLRLVADSTVADESADRDVRDDPALSAIIAEDRAVVRRALASLPVDQQKAIEMAYFGGMTQTEIAGALGQPLGTIKTRIRLGMQKLRASLVALEKAGPR